MMDLWNIINDDDDDDDDELSHLILNSAPSRLGCTHSGVGYSKGCCIKHEQHRSLTYLVFLQTHVFPSVTYPQYHKLVPKT